MIVTQELCPYFQSECKGLNCLSFTRKYTKEAFTKCVKYEKCADELKKAFQKSIQEQSEDPFRKLEINRMLMSKHFQFKDYISSEMIKKCANCEDNIHGYCKLLDINIIFSLPQTLEKNISDKINYNEFQNQ